jgi:gamma-glutamyl:cysteine ligase YbdK (ATP-grasp superfamily)
VSAAHAPAGVAARARITLGIEEEVFVCEPEAPSLASLGHLARLMWSDPRRHYARTASNFAREDDLRHGLMSCVEISTGVHSDAEAAVEDLATRRRELGRAVGDAGLIVPLGSLLQTATPTNTAALQIHVGAPDREAAYANLARYLPVLAVLGADSPAANGARFGQSWRMANGFAVGPLLPDPTARFQDLIVSKRLGTIEVRLLDPVWDLARVRVLAGAVAAIAALPTRPLDRDAYNVIRDSVVREGLTDAVRPLAAELSQIADVPEAMLTRTAADEVWDHFQAHGLVPTYSALDHGWREGVFETRDVPPMRASVARAAFGVAGYYLPKLPYVTWKYLKEK